MMLFSQSLENIILCISLVTLVCLWLRKYLVRIFTVKAPCMEMNVIVFYFTMLKYIYKNKNINYRTYIFEVIFALGKLFEREQLFALWVILRPIIILHKSESAEAVLGSNALIEKAEEYRFLHPWLKTGLLTSGGEKWKSRRKLLTPSFHFRILEDFISVFNEQSYILINKLKVVSNREWVDIIPLVTMCTLDIICSSSMGVSVNAQSDPESEYVRAIHISSDQVIYRMSRPWLWIDEIYHFFPSGRKYKKCLETLHGFTRKVIKEKKIEILRERSRNSQDPITTTADDLPVKKKRKAFLEMLLELHINENILSEEDIREEVDTFTFEGHDTTAMAICWCLYNIGLHPKVQTKLCEEIHEIFADDKTRPVTNEDIKAMKYLDCVLKESLRLYPSVPVYGREVHEKSTIAGYTIVPGCVIAICPLLIHRDPEVYPNPEKFDPDRFLPENSFNRSPFAYVPFSGGPRNCIGQRFAAMEEKTIIANILRNFELKSLDERDKIILMPDVILRPSGPLRLHFTPR